MNELIGTARLWTGRGVGAFPVHVDTELGTKSPVGKWKAQAAQSLVDLDSLPWERGNALGLAMGYGFELLEFEGKFLQEHPDWINDLEGSIPRNILFELSSGYVEMSMRGGLHFIYESHGWEVPGNEKVAKRGKETLIETRGTGGFVVVAPSPGYNILSDGDPAWLEWGDRVCLFDLLGSLYGDPLVAARAKTNSPKNSGKIHTSHNRPGDRFNDDPENTWESILGPHSWQISHEGEDGRVYWTRPSKSVDQGHSAVTGGATNHMYVWSGEDSLPEEEPLDKFAVYTYLNHDGDFKAAAKSLIMNNRKTDREKLRDGRRTSRD